MSSIFDAYDEEFLALTQDLSNNISHITTYETDAGELLFWRRELKTIPLALPSFLPDMCAVCVLISAKKKLCFFSEFLIGFCRRCSVSSLNTLQNVYVLEFAVPMCNVCFTHNIQLIAFLTTVMSWGTHFMYRSGWGSRPCCNVDVFFITSPRFVLVYSTVGIDCQLHAYFF